MKQTWERPWTMWSRLGADEGPHGGDVSPTQWRMGLCTVPWGRTRAGHQAGGRQGKVKPISLWQCQGEGRPEVRKAEVVDVVEPLPTTSPVPVAQVSHMAPKFVEKTIQHSRGRDRVHQAGRTVQPISKCPSHPHNQSRDQNRSRWHPTTPSPTSPR